MGHRKLLRGINAYKAAHPTSSDTFMTSWKPFYLDPLAPVPSVDKRERYYSRFGSRQRAHAAFDRLGAIGKDLGINFSFSGKTGNTRDSHRLIQLAKTKSEHVQTKVVEELFTAYFEKEKDITSHEVLREAGVNGGLEEHEVKQWLESDMGGKEVDEEVEEAQMRDIHGVPYFTFQDKYEISGAQDEKGFVQIFEKIKAEEV